MTKETLLMQYQSECFEALKSVSKVSKPFEKVLMDTLKLFMAIPGKVNFLQMGRYGEFSNRPTVTTSRTRLSTGLPLTSISSERFSMESFWPSPSILVFFPSPERRRLG